MNDAQSGAILGEKMRQAVRNQLANADPPIAAETFARLTMQGIADDEVIRMMAHCLTIITYDILKTSTPFDGDRYARMLQSLPDEEVIYTI